MSDAIGYLLSFAALLILAPLPTWLGRRHGRSIKGGLLMASVLLGFGEPLDPPSTRSIEANAGKEEDAPAPGEPKDVAGGS